MKNSKKRWLYLPVEVKVRELDAKLLLSYYAALQDYRVVIGEHKMVELAAHHYPKGIFFSKGYPNRFRKRIISTAVKQGHKVVELDEEGLIIHDRKNYLFDRMRTDISQLVTQQYCWGAFQQDLLLKSSTRKNKNYYITGNPRFDLLNVKYRLLYQEEIQQLQQLYGPYILINTRFSRYNSIVGQKKNDEHAKYIKSLYDHFISMIEQIAKQYPDKNIIIRPHPGENFSTYKRFFSSFDNVHIIHEGNIIKWLIAASVIIHNGCTSSIEAFLLQKPIISFMPITSKKFDVELPNLLGVKATTNKEVIHLLSDLDNIRHSKSKYKKLLAYLNHYCKCSTNYFAAETILSLLYLVQGIEPKYFPPTRRLLQRKEQKYVTHFFPSFHIKEIESFYQKLNKIENRQDKFLIRNLGKNIFCIEKST